MKALEHVIIQKALSYLVADRWHNQLMAKIGVRILTGGLEICLFDILLKGYIFSLTKRSAETQSIMISFVFSLGSVLGLGSDLSDRFIYFHLPCHSHLVPVESICNIAPLGSTRFVLRDQTPAGFSANPSPVVSGTNPHGLLAFVVFA